MSLYWTWSQRETQPTFTKNGDKPYRAPTPDSTRCHCAHECNDAIHISNSNGSYTIILHIIQTIMLTHQLACINISFFIHISSHSIQAITYKQNTWMNFSPIINSDFLTVPEQYVGCPWTTPLIKHRFHFFGTEIHGHFWPHDIQNHFHGSLDKK